MGTDVVYEIARFMVDASGDEVLVDRTQLILDGGTLRRLNLAAEESAIDGSDILAAIAADPMIGLVRCEQVTRISCSQTIADKLPLVLSVLAIRDHEEDDEEEEDDDDDDDESVDVSCEVYVNGERWNGFASDDSGVVLPDPDGNGWQPGTIETWGEFSFDVAGGVMQDSIGAAIGLASPDVIVVRVDSGPYSDMYVRDRSADARTIYGWLMGALPIAAEYQGGSGGDTYRMLAQLFIEATLHDRNGQTIDGDALAAGVAKSGDSFGVKSSADWTLQLNLADDLIAGVLDEIAADPDLADLVAAARDPESLEGMARRAAIKQWSGEE